MATKADCLEALLEAAERLGESPTKAQYEELGLTPASATIIRTCDGWNEAKEKAGLETNPSTGSRVGPKPDGVDLPDGTSWDELSVDQRWHYRNVEWNTERSLRRRARLRSWVNERKRDRGCVRCGEDDVACLDLHHKSGQEKRMNVSQMITYGYGKDALRDELEKCEVLCANCHRRTHYSPPKRELKRWVHERKQADGCTRCGEDHPACLDFHHISSEKDDTTSNLVSDNRSKQHIRCEMDDCRVLCANCHRIEHYEAPVSD